MAEFVSEFFDRIIPGAQGYGERFLKLIRDRAKVDVPYELHHAAADRTGRVVLHAKIGGGRLEVFADDVGRSLHTGWMLITSRPTGVLSGTTFVQSMQNARDIEQASPEVIRSSSAMIGVLHVAVFLPTLEQLAESVAFKHSVRGPAGFFAA